MKKSLKEQNKPSLYLLIAANFIVYYGLSQGIELISDTSLSFTRQFKNILPVGLGLLLVGIANALVEANLKAKIVFLRWKNPLPGARAFQEDMLRKDPRVDIEELRLRCGNFPEAPEDQNSLWYRIYRRHKSEESVIEAHKNFLFTRDCTVLVLIISLILVPLAFFQFPALWLALCYACGMFGQLLIIMISARNNGNRFVFSVLAIESSEQVFATKKTRNKTNKI